MPNKKGGKKFKKGKKNTSQFQRKLIIKNEAEGVDDQEYAKVLKVSGSGRFRLLCFDGKERMGTICGQMRKRVWVNLNDVVLVSLWTGIQDDKCTIIHKYDMDEAYKMKDMGQFPTGFTLEENEDEDEDLFTMMNPPSSSSSSEEEDTDYFSNVGPGVSGDSGSNDLKEDFDFDDI
jgi:translation initiation factor 1A